MNEPLVSIITPVYNAERFLSDTIKSVQNQTYKNWEILLIDDCSKDNSAQIIKEFQKYDNRIKYIKLKNNSGASVSRNEGIRNAKGRFIAFVDSDDIWKPEKLEIQIKYMLKENLGFTFTSYRYMKENGELTNKIAKAPSKINYNGLLKNTIIGCSTVVIDRDIVGDFEMPLVRRGQDTATWLQILRREKYAYGIQMDLVNYRLVGNSLSSNNIKHSNAEFIEYKANIPC